MFFFHPSQWSCFLSSHVFPLVLFERHENNSNFCVVLRNPVPVSSTNSEDLFRKSWILYRDFNTGHNQFCVRLLGDSTKDLLRFFIFKICCFRSTKFHLVVAFSDLVFPPMFLCFCCRQWREEYGESAYFAKENQFVDREQVYNENLKRIQRLNAEDKLVATGMSSFHFLFLSKTPWCTAHGFWLAFGVTMRWDLPVWTVMCHIPLSFMRQLILNVKFYPCLCVLVELRLLWISLQRWHQKSFATVFWCGHRNPPSFRRRGRISTVLMCVHPWSCHDPFLSFPDVWMWL